ncbi:MAG TPA: hypothetical protein VMR46_04010 [Candidatus Paceibacterota bacterium]|jgi:hypothetical protein|nr:hypothetical protein [Candidatus Paceibacterota bacterium]
MTKGFTLFFALLISSLALAIGLAIYDITVRELQLSEAATQSQYAIYAADTGAECALYWENKYQDGSGNPLNGGTSSAFATSSADTQYAVSGVICSGQDIAAAAVAAGTWPQTSDANDATTTFAINGATTAAPCSVVYVYKSGNPSVTTVVSHGYNTCATGNLQLERVFQVTY